MDNEKDAITPDEFAQRCQPHFDELQKKLVEKIESDFDSEFSVTSSEGDTPQQKAQKELDLIALRLGGSTGGLVASEDGKSVSFNRPKPYQDERNG